MGDGEHQDFVGTHFVDDQVGKFRCDRSTYRHVVRDRFEMRILPGVLLDAEQCVMQDVQEPMAKPGLPTFIPSRCGVSFSFRKIQKSNRQAQGDISFRSDSIS